MTNPIKSFARRVLYAPAFAKWTHRYTEWRVAKGQEAAPATDADGLPIPDPFLITIVAGKIGWQDFLAGGSSALQTFANAIDRNGGDFLSMSKVLDFGCGCGRLARHVPKLTDAALYGVDYNGRLVEWCAENLPGTFSKNQLNPPLAFEDNMFDAMWVLSVFTHLRIDTQNAWLEEYARVLKPGGYCLITFHDEDHPNLAMTDITLDQLMRDKVAIFNDKAEGSNLISTFQTRGYASEQFSKHFDVLEIVPSVDNPIHQAIAVLRKK